MATKQRVKACTTFHLRQSGNVFYLNDVPVSLPQSLSSLPTWLTDAIREAPSQGGIRLLLDSSLPAEWQRLPWEKLPFEDRRLGESVQVIRRYTLISPFHLSGKGLLLDRWPNNFFIERVQGEILNGRLDARRGEAVDRWLAGRPDLSHYREIFVVAHGAVDPSPLLTEQGLPWFLEMSCILPSTVWILACEEAEGELDGLIDSLLATGVRCVVSSDGLLSAHLIVKLMADWCCRDSESLADWLLSRQKEEQGMGGADALQIYGCPPGPLL